jgi:GT2 family glycosyltransferase
VETVDALPTTPERGRYDAPAAEPVPGPTVGPTPTPAVSVCVPVYKGERFLAVTLEHLLAQTMPDVEIVVLDNASPDKSAEIAASYRDPRIRIEHNPETLPLTANWNRAIALARAPLVKLVCADDLIHPRCLEIQAAELEADPEAALVVHRQDLVDGHGRRLARSRFLRGMLGRLDHTEVLRRTVRDGANPIGAPVGVMFLRSAFDATVGFRHEKLFLADLDLYLQLSAQGPLIGRAPTLASFRVVAGTVSAAAGRAEYAVQRRFTRELARQTEVRRRDVVVGVLNAPLKRLRRETIFAASRWSQLSSPPAPGT